MKGEKSDDRTWPQRGHHLITVGRRPADKWVDVDVNMHSNRVPQQIGDPFRVDVTHIQQSEGARDARTLGYYYWTTSSSFYIMVINILWKQLCKQLYHNQINYWKNSTKVRRHEGAF